MPPAPTRAQLVTECAAFGSFAEEANAYYAANSAAQPFLDPNLDGRACEVFFGVDQAAAPPPAPPPSGGGCDPAHPTVRIPPPPPYLNCPDVGVTNFTVVQPYPHGFDGEYDGVGCESSASGDSGGGAAPPPSSGGGDGGPVSTDFGGLDGVDRACYDFGSQGAAQAHFESDGGSVYNNADGLDRNHNGLACEPGEFD